MLGMLGLNETPGENGISMRGWNGVLIKPLSSSTGFSAISHRVRALHSPVHTAMRNCTRDEGGPFEVGNQVLISSHHKQLSSKAMVVNVAEKSEQDFGRHD